MKYPVYVNDSYQASMMDQNYRDTYAICSCGYIEANKSTDFDCHNETCQEKVAWQWRPLSYDYLTDQTTKIMHTPIHYYYKVQWQTSLRCSFCARAPKDTVHVTCRANWPISPFTEVTTLIEPNMNSDYSQCFSVAMGPDEIFCEAHWLDMK